MPEDEVPLLDSKFPDCRACKYAHLTARGAGPPVKELCMVAVITLCNALPISSLYPFLYFMVEDFHIAKVPEDIGYYAGAIGSVFMFGRFLSSIPWGILSDKYGRRPAIFCGLVSIIIFQPIFGIAKNFYTALVARLLLGTFNGMIGPLKAYASEICNEENQAWGLTIMSTSWSLGLIIGPSMGGFLARPAVNFPGIFSEDSLFGHYPYLLPSLCQAVFAVFVLGVVFFLPETVHKHREKHADHEQVLIVKEKPKTTSLLLNWPLMASVIIYCIWSLHETAFMEVFSLWCVSPVETGGLSLETSDVGLVLSISGLAMLCLQILFYPPLNKRFGPIRVMRSTAVAVICLVWCFPFISKFHGTEQWILLNLLSLARNVMSAMVITGTLLLTNNSVPIETRGAANGISMTSGSVLRAIGPASAGAIFAYGQTRKTSKFLPGSQLVFAILDIICVVGLFTMLPSFLPNSLNWTFEACEREDSKALSTEEFNDTN